ncbi:unnamed protein product [Rotaria sp. Silwood2]|nr:unnamed protein product [Rotaria sp. Silwood2]CAF2875638.1 unnamed protein product [Rotaria sp. Silwood2]CAF3960554.1 unnamed protein product [Rotaria sp. Silwood2]CAF4123832.1 unnamed protein product [Rotaria sp. Silwood2]
MAQPKTIPASTAQIEKKETENKNFADLVIDEQTIAAAIREQDGELVSLHREVATKKWTLSLGYGYATQWQKATEKDEISNRNGVFVLSLLGNTTVGKSFVTKRLLTNTEYGPQLVDENKMESSTTGNINCFESRAPKDLAEKMLVLDYEGEKGSSFPLMLHAREFFTERIDLNSDYGKERCKAVTEYFPKLAYVLSNIVILIGTEELISADFLSRCYEFALSANTNISNIPYLPVLIIIENKCSLVKKFGIKDVTNEFFYIHRQEADDLKKYFSEIYCLRLPHTGHTQKVKGVRMVGEAVVDEQLAALKNLIADIILRHRERLITHVQWLFLLERVLASVSSGKSVSMHSLLSEMTSSIDNGNQSIVKKIFIHLYFNGDLRTPEFYQYCRNFAMRVLSRNVAIKLLQQEETLSDRFIRDTCKTEMLLMWKILDDYKPCEARYTGHGTSISGTSVFCYQNKGSHPRHRTSEGIKNMSWITSLFGRPSTVVWYGDFVNNDAEQPSAKELEDFTNLTREFLNCFKQTPEEKYVKFKTLLQEAHIESRPRISQANLCDCCLKMMPRNLEEKIAYRYLRSYLRLIETASSVITICKSCKNELNMISLTNRSMPVSRTIAEALVTEVSVDNTISDGDDCAICMADKKDYTLVPCGHHGFCFDCATRMQQEYGFCPICRKNIESILKSKNT